VGYRAPEYDRIVVGAGALGTSTAYHFSRIPGRTLVLERFHENHTFGSSHGRTRILRTAYAEGAAYIPIVLRARELWKRLGREAGREIFRPTGALLAAQAGSIPLGVARTNARRYHLPHEWWNAEDVRTRFPMFRLDAGDAALWDPDGGMLFPERAIRAYRRLAHARGVVFRWNSPVLRWTARPDELVGVETATREYLARELVMTAGAWLPTLVPDLRLPLEVEQQTVYWFRPRGRAPSSYRAMPTFVFYDPRGGYYYGTPDVGAGVKVGGSEGQRVRDVTRRPSSSARELESIRAFVSHRLPGLSTTPRQQTRCLYTNTPDKNFLVDFHPDHPNVLLVSACSGHGFKFASAMGELIAEASRARRLSPLLEPFRRRGARPSRRKSPY
jgi:sarcosine oxidase